MLYAGMTEEVKKPASRKGGRLFLCPNEFRLSNLSASGALGPALRESVFFPAQGSH